MFWRIPIWERKNNMGEDNKEEITQEVVECCDKPRGFVGGPCDYYSEIVQPETEWVKNCNLLPLDDIGLWTGYDPEKSLGKE
jgi:hypothetical protein